MNRMVHAGAARLLAGLPVALALLLLAVWACPARAQLPGVGPPNKQPPLNAPSTDDTFRPYDAFTDEDEFDWTPVYVFGGIGLVLVIIVIVAVKQQKKTKKRTGGPIDTNVIAGYRLKNHLMTGQASQVWEVVEEVSMRHFAMKLLLPEKTKDREHMRLLFHEAEVGKALAHPNIIKIIKVIHDPRHPAFVMEFFPSGSLKLKIMHKQNDFIREHAINIFKQTATALAFMHAKGWVHRDVKADNILVNASGEVRLIDFALAQRMKTGGGLGKLVGMKTKAAGTRSYMSPEQIRGETLDGRADIYSFGAAAYEIVTGRPPFRAASSQELLAKHITEKPASPQIHNPDVTDDFAGLILHCLQKKKEARPKDFHEILMKLRTMKVFKSEQPAKKE